MLLHPAVIALLLSAVIIAAMVFYSSCYGFHILRNWDIRSGSELQLRLERRTYLISLVLTYVLGFQIISLFLFVYTADNLHSLFVGAMCAAGTLNVNSYGYPLLILKMANFLAAGIWLIINFTDNKAYDYPLIKKKYILLLLITPFFLAESVMQVKYFLGLKADVITSCCGSLFSLNRDTVASELAALPYEKMRIAFYGGMAATTASGGYFMAKGKGALLFSALSGVAFLTSLAALISFISLYFYELPTHHCPFCILQWEYGFIGYPLYIMLFVGAVSGMGVGILSFFKNIKSLAWLLPALQRKLAATALVSFLLFLLIVTYKMIFSNLILG
jgi:hypothetical protein